MESSLSCLYVVLGWVLWCALHSALISVTVTEYMKHKLGGGFRFYRLFYNLFSLGTIIPLFYYSATLRGEPLFSWEGSLRVVSYLLRIVGLSLFIIGGWNYDLSHLFGIRQIREGNQPPSGVNTFAVSGIHKVIRHPWYLGGILIVWGEDLSLSIILINLVLTSYFIIGSILEERKLVREFGEPYREYQKTVSMLFPMRWLKTQMASAFRLSSSSHWKSRCAKR